ncbi:hypothetical protein [Paludisphaera borealis]|uniref:Uncharacterized protein n=1 Tax=Paludisphaera borealis TaxID=1387353 RepID=A0A1U7CRR5_9BACT|nr:hypothetical protein [Paludisphaera borealis]APW61640.1 hypothetical protein BSF38_03165 [Paludisphaera borealis]
MLDYPDFAFLDNRGKGPAPVLAWACVYVANLPYPLFCGVILTTDSGRMGMVLGILAVFLTGYRSCFVYREAILTVAYGGWIVAAFQFVPFLQVMAGLIGVAVAEATGQAASGDLGPINTVLGGFLATLVTGGILIALAAVLGLMTRGLTRMLNPADHGIAAKKAL